MHEHRPCCDSPARKLPSPGTPGFHQGNRDPPACETTPTKVLPKETQVAHLANGTMKPGPCPLSQELERWVCDQLRSGLGPWGSSICCTHLLPHTRDPWQSQGAQPSWSGPSSNSCHLPDCGFSHPWAGPGPTTSRVKYPELTGPGFYESTSLAGGLLPSPLPVLKQLTTTPVRDAG